MRDKKYWKMFMEAEGDVEASPEESEETTDRVDQEETQIIEELVYPYELTTRMTQLYADPLYKRLELGELYSEAMWKLLRSLKYWRLRIPNWLVGRLRK